MLFTKNTGFRVKPGMTGLVILLLFATLCLPHLAYAAKTIMVFGDSLSAAYGIPRESGWVTLLQQQLQKAHPEYQVVNASISGETTTGGVQRIASALKQHKPAIVIIELGANDGLRGAPIPDTEANLAKLIERSRKAHARVLLLGMMLPPNYGLDYTLSFRKMYPGLAKKYHISLVPFLLDGIMPTEFQADNLHPVAEAQPRILQNVMRKLEPMLE